MKRTAATSTLLEFQAPSTAITTAPTPLMARGTIWAVASMFAACVAAAGLIPVDKVVTAQGRIVSDAANLVVQPLDTAIVRSIDVREGQRVRRGDLLARLDPTFATADAGALESQVASLGAEVERMGNELDGKPYKPKTSSPATQLQSSIYAQHMAERQAKMEGYNQKIQGLYATEQRAEADQHGYASRLVIAQQVETMRQALEHDAVGSKLNTLSAMDSRMEVERGLATAVQTIESSKRDLAAMVSERDGYNQSWRSEMSQKLGEQRRTLSDATENLDKAQLRERMVELRAPRDAIVLSVAKVSVGSVLQSGEQFLTLVPTDGVFEVEANISGRDDGFVAPGDRVAIKFDTFAFAQYGMDEGRVTTISPDSFTAQDEQRTRTGNIPVAPGSTESFYRARISIETSGLHDTPAGFRVVPGMPVTADIKVGKRTILGYLMGKIIPVTNEGMREP